MLISGISDIEGWKNLCLGVEVVFLFIFVLYTGGVVHYLRNTHICFYLLGINNCIFSQILNFNLWISKYRWFKLTKTHMTIQILISIHNLSSSSLSSLHPFAISLTFFILISSVPPPSSFCFLSKCLFALALKFAKAAESLRFFLISLSKPGGKHLFYALSFSPLLKNQFQNPY